MIDEATKQRVRVTGGEARRAYVRVSAEQAEDDGGPFIAVIDLGFGANLEAIQVLLDSAR